MTAGCRQDCPPHEIVGSANMSQVDSQLKENQKSKCKNVWAGPRAGLGRNFQGLAAIKTTVNDSILERRRKLATSRNLRGARRNGTLVAHAFSETSLRK
jgi:hypothetical protein